MSEAYRDAGVNLELGDELSKQLYEASKLTWQNREGVFGELTSNLDSFSGLRSMNIGPLLEVPEPEKLSFLMGDDGVGTKVEVAQRVGDLSTIAHDLFAMVCDDAVIRGFEPVAATTTLDVQKLDESMRDQMAQLALGYIAAGNLAKIAVVNGEVAELGKLVGGYEPSNNDYRSTDEILRFNWSATLLSIGHQDRLKDGRSIQPNDSLVALEEKGFRSNGLSLVRKTFEKSFGVDWHNTRINSGEQSLGQLVLEPSTIYTPVIVDAFGGYDPRRQANTEIAAAAHITGGGIPGKLSRMLQASGLGADIESPMGPGDGMILAQNHAGISDEEAYKVWNMGQGMIVATAYPQDFIEHAANHGINAEHIGYVTKKPEIHIRSAGAHSRGKNLVYSPE